MLIVMTVFFPVSIRASKFIVSCNNINDLYLKLGIPDVAKNLNAIVSNLMLRTNEMRNIEWHKTCKCKSRLDTSVCNNKQGWSKDK